MVGTEYTFAGVREVGGRLVAVPLRIEEHDERADAQFRRCWDKLRQAIKNFHECTETTDGCPNWAFWNVLDRIANTKDATDRVKYAAWDGDALAGFVHVRPNFRCDGRTSPPVLYVENMAARLGNMRPSCGAGKGCATSVRPFLGSRSLRAGLERTDL